MFRVSTLRPALLLLPLLAALPAQAQVARHFSSATYTGLGGSQVSTDYDNLKEAINLDAIGGFRIVPAQKWGSLSAELNISISVSPGKNEGVPSSTGGVIGGGAADCGKCTSDPDDFASQNFSLLATYRTPGRFYGLGQAGYSLSLTSIDEIEEHGRGGFSYGGGIGFRFGQETAAVEVLYQQVSEDLQTIGIRLIY
jgi:hypothetical protein